MPGRSADRDGCVFVHDAWVRHAITELRWGAGHHFVQGNRRGVTLGMQIPTRRRSIGEERIKIRPGASLDILRRGTA